jgi:hypothetical protein
VDLTKIVSHEPSQTRPLAETEIESKEEEGGLLSPRYGEDGGSVGSGWR